jgi:hypothetical protein
MEKWFLALRIFGIGFSCVFFILGMLVVSLKIANGILSRFPSPQGKK